MENLINKVVLTGNVGTDVEVRTVGNNQKLARVNLAVNEYFKNAAGEEVKKTQWFSLTFWNAKADLAAEIKKGTRVAIEGRLQTNTYQAKDGSTRYTTDIVVNELEIKSSVLVS